MMLYLFPFLDSVVVEYRYDGKGPIRSNSWQWRLRNWVWKTGSPAFGTIVTIVVPFRRIRSWILDTYNRLSQLVVTWLIRGCKTSPADQIILYPETTGWDGFLTAYNEFCIQHNETPLFNQSRGITPLQAKAAFGPEIRTFLEYRRKYDPEDRFYTEYFRRLFE